MVPFIILWRLFRIFWLRLRELGSQNLKIGCLIGSSLGSYSFCIENSESSKVDRNNQTIQYKKYKSTDRPPVSLAGVKHPAVLSIMIEYSIQISSFQQDSVVVRAGVFQAGDPGFKSGRGRFLFWRNCFFVRLFSLFSLSTVEVIMMII